MRLCTKDVFTDHDLLTNVLADDHHSQTAAVRISVGGTSIPFGSYNLLVPLGKSGCRTLRAILKGTTYIDTQGYDGIFCTGGASSAQSCSFGIAPYPAAVASYMGGYSRLHGDSYLSTNCFGGSAIRLNDCYISGSDAVFVFYNTSGSPVNLVVYGVCAAK